MCTTGSGSAAASVQAAVAGLVDVDVVGLSDGGLREMLVALLPAARQLHAVIALVSASFEVRGLASGDGCASTRSWLTAFGRLSGGASAGLVAAGGLLRQLPVLAAAAGRGEVSGEQLAVIGRLAERIGVDKVRLVDRILAEACVSLGPAQVARACARVAGYLDPDGPEPDPDADFARRLFSLGRDGQMLRVRGQLDAEAGALLATALDALMTPPTADDTRTAGQRRADALGELARLFLTSGQAPTVGGVRPQIGVLITPQTLLHDPDSEHSDCADADQDHPGPDHPGSDHPDHPDHSVHPDSDHPEPGDHPEPRPGRAEGSRSDPGQPEAQARGGADDGAGESGAKNCGAETSRAENSRAETSRAENSGAENGDAQAGRAQDSGVAGAGGSLGIGSLGGGSPFGGKASGREPAWMQWFGDIPTALAQRLACDADVWRIVLDPNSGLPLDVGRTHRLVPYWMRKALHARDRGCRWPGCAAPAPWTDAHHLKPWYFGGETAIDVLILLCRFHHSRVHEGRWRIKFDPNTGEVSVLRPDGRPYEIAASQPWVGPNTRRADPGPPT